MTERRCNYVIVIVISAERDIAAKKKQKIAFVSVDVYRQSRFRSRNMRSKNGKW